MTKNKIAVIGATGNVGRKVVAMLLTRQLVLPENLILFASSRSVGKSLTILGHPFQIADVGKEDFSSYSICIFNTESDVSEKYIPRALKSGAYVVDSSSKYRLESDVPLIIPPVNKHQIQLNTKLYAHANCLVSPIACVLAPLHQFNPVQHLYITTYQATSGAGKRASDDCWNETKSLINNERYERQHFQRQIAFNVIPQVGDIMPDGMTHEEFKIIHELRKVVSQDLAISVTSVRVPVISGHSIALGIKFSQSFDKSELLNLLNRSKNIKAYADDYKTPIEILDSDDVHVGRIRLDSALKNGLQLWLCSDNLRRGAATDSVEIVESLLNELSTVN